MACANCANRLSGHHSLSTRSTTSTHVKMVSMSCRHADVISPTVQSPQVIDHCLRTWLITLKRAARGRCNFRTCSLIVVTVRRADHRAGQHSVVHEVAPSKQRLRVTAGRDTRARSMVNLGSSGSASCRKNHGALDDHRSTCLRNAVSSSNAPKEKQEKNGSRHQRQNRRSGSSSKSLSVSPTRKTASEQTGNGVRPLRHSATRLLMGIP